jgi:hypothetical protein
MDETIYPNFYYAITKSFLLGEIGRIQMSNYQLEIKFIESEVKVKFHDTIKVHKREMYSNCLVTKLVHRKRKVHAIGFAHHFFPPLVSLFDWSMLL